MLLALVVPAAFGALAFSRASAFHARSIEVSGNEHLTRAQVLRLADISKETNVVWLDEGEVERKLESDAWIAGADVRVSLPLTIRIVVTERTPVAVNAGPVGAALIAADGTTLGAGPRRGLPVIQFVAAGRIEGPPPNATGAARAVGALTPELRQDVKRVVVLLDGTLDMFVRGGPAIHFGTPEHAARKARVIERVLSWAAEEGTRIEALSVVAPSSPAARLSD